MKAFLFLIVLLLAQNAVFSQGLKDSIDSLASTTLSTVDSVTPYKVVNENDGLPIIVIEWLYYILAFVCGAVFMFLLKGTRTEKKHRSVERTSSSQNFSYDNRDLEIQKLRKEIKSLESQIRDYELHIKNFEKGLGRNEGQKNYPRTMEWKVSDSNKVMPPSSEKEVFLFFPNPTEDGDFVKSNGKDYYMEGTSVYKFLLHSPTEASFEFCQERSAIGMALYNRHELIRSVSEELNPYSITAASIICETKGKAILDGEMWKVTQKARIKYV